MSHDEAAIWIVQIKIRLRDRNGNSWEGTGFKRMGGHLTFARAADTSTMVKVVNRTSEAPPGATRKSIFQGESGAGWSATFDDPTAAAEAIGLNSGLTEIVADAGAQLDLADYAPAEGDYWYSADSHNHISNAAVVRANGLLVADNGNAATWVTITPLLKGDYVIPTTNTSPPAITDHFYKVIEAGTTDVPEPVWPTDGTTIVDGTVTLQDMGLVIAAEITDYRISSATYGEFVRVVGSDLVTGEPILTSYDYAAFSGERYSPGTEYTHDGIVKFNGYNEFDGQQISGYIPNAKIFGTSAMDAGSRAVTITGCEISPQPIDPASPPPGTPADWDFANETERITKWFT